MQFLGLCSASIVRACMLGCCDPYLGTLQIYVRSLEPHASVHGSILLCPGLLDAALRNPVELSVCATLLGSMGGLLAASELTYIMWVRTSQTGGRPDQALSLSATRRRILILYCRSRSRCSQAVMRRPKPDALQDLRCLLKGAGTNEAYRLPSCAIEARSLIQPRKNATNDIQSLDGLAR